MTRYSTAGWRDQDALLHTRAIYDEQVAVDMIVVLFAGPHDGKRQGCYEFSTTPSPKRVCG
jgi:hypothetical protein